jgi:hypothetical protein
MTKFVGSFIPTWDSQECFTKQLGRPGRRVVAFMQTLAPIRY